MIAESLIIFANAAFRSLPFKNLVMRGNLNEHNLIYYNNNIFMLYNKKLFKILRNIKWVVETPPKARARCGCPH